MGTEKTRRKKIEWLKDTISSFFKEKPNSKISKSRLLAEFCLDNNSTERTGREILDLLEKTKFIKIKGDEIEDDRK